MPIKLVWDDTIPHVVHYQFRQGWTWEEFRLTALEEHRWGEALGGVRYDVIGDLTQANVPGGTPFTNVHRLFNQGPTNRRMIVIAGSPLARTMIAFAGRLYPQMQGRFHPAPTIEQAREIILKLRAQAAE